MCTIFTALAGACSPHRSSISRLMATVRLASSKRRASSACCARPPSGIGFPARSITSGPRTRADNLPSYSCSMRCTLRVHRAGYIGAGYLCLTGPVPTCLLCGVELLERDGALAALADANAAAARGQGRIVCISGEPGIGKTSLVKRFVEGLGDGARVLVGTCDDLSIPRPLGPFRDLAGSVSEELERALAGDAAPHDIQDLLIAEL